MKKTFPDLHHSITGVGGGVWNFPHKFHFYLINRDELRKVSNYSCFCFQLVYLNDEITQYLETWLNIVVSKMKPGKPYLLACKLGRCILNLGEYLKWRSLFKKYLCLALYLCTSLLSNSSHLLILRKIWVTLLFCLLSNPV